MKNKVKLIVNPFIRIAGGQALIWGFLGLIVSTLLCWISGYHYHGLLHFGPAPNPAWWCYLAEHLIVWLIPALLFYLGGLFLSHSRIRVIDVLGTVLFAQLPLLGMNLISLLPAMRMMSQMNMNMSPEEMLAQPYFILAMILTLLGLPFLILTLIWMFNALKVSCNLKQWKLWTVALIGIIGGDVLCRFLIGQKILIYGENFGNDPSLIEVTIGGQKAPVVNVQSTVIYCIVPTKAYSLSLIHI